MTTTDYVSGGMTGFPRFNFHIFDEVRDVLVAEGRAVISPADHDRAVLAKAGVEDIDSVPGFAEGNVEWYAASFDGMSTDALLGWDFKAIIDDCDRIVMLPGWESSTGARYERLVAEATGKEVILAVRRDKADGTDETWVFEPDEEAKRVSDHLRSLGAPIETAGEPTTVMATVHDELTIRDLLDELERRLGHVPTMRQRIDGMRANLA